MAQWIALAITITGWIIAAAALWGRMTQRQDGLESRITHLEDNSQTSGEREAVADAIEIRLKAHEEKVDLRFQNFQNLQASIHAKLDTLIALARSNNGR